MSRFLDQFIADQWNRAWGQAPRVPARAIRLGRIVHDGRVTNRWIALSESSIAASLFVAGSTGVGKTSLIAHLLFQFLEQRWSVIANSLHPDLSQFFYAAVAHIEQSTGADCSGRFIAVNPADPSRTVGFNLLHLDNKNRGFVLAEEIAEALRTRNHEAHEGVRTAEVLRFALLTLADNRRALPDLFRFFLDDAFRNELVHRVSNATVQQYYSHFNQLSEAQRSQYQAPVLRRVSELIADPRIRHLIGQASSEVTFQSALDSQKWLLLELNKTEFGAQARALFGLFFASQRAAVFSRRNRKPAIIICDEIQNLPSGSGLEHSLVENRKFSTAILASCQNFSQLDSDVRAAVFGSGTQIYFRLAGDDAGAAAAYLDGGKRLAERLRHLPRQHAIVKTGGDEWQEIAVPHVAGPSIDWTDLYRRSCDRWARNRNDIERELLWEPSSASAEYERGLDESWQ